jgi:hypothetical protein
MYDEYSDWGMVECECQNKVAYGCGPLGQQIVEGLTLLADLRGCVPKLAVRATDEILSRMEEEVPGELAKRLGPSLSELHDEMLEIYGTKVCLDAGVHAVDDDMGLVVLRACPSTTLTTRSGRTTSSTMERRRRSVCSRTDQY